jgi:hypothetical protein
MSRSAWASAASASAAAASDEASARSYLEAHPETGERRAHLMGRVVAELALAPQDILDAAVGVGQRGTDGVELGDAGRVRLDGHARLGDPPHAGGEPLHRRGQAPGLEQRKPHGRRDGDQREDGHRQPHAAHVVGALARRRERRHVEPA